MSRSTDIKTYRTIPAGLSALVGDVIHDHLAFINGQGNGKHKVSHYAGEFLAEDNIERLLASVSQFPTVMWDVETIEEMDVDDSQTMPEDLFRFIIYCCNSNRFDESIQWSSSYELAWDVKNAFQGLKFNSVSDIHAEGFFQPQTIERELHVPGMSVHTFRVNAEVISNSRGVFDTGLQGGFLFDNQNLSHYIPIA